MKAFVVAMLAGVLAVSSASVTTLGQAQAEEEALQQYEVKIDGMT